MNNNYFYNQFFNPQYVNPLYYQQNQAEIIRYQQDQNNDLAEMARESGWNNTI